MAFELENVVPWGRTMGEYQSMFALSPKDFKRKIISFGDGPASFNQEMTALGNAVVSIDPIYQFSKNDIENRILETKEIVMSQIRQNEQQFDWSVFKDADALEKCRMEAMQAFLDDFEMGKNQNRYIFHALPQPMPFDDLSFELGLSSHFLLLYAELGLSFHLQAIYEMLRVCEEVRIFPLLNLSGQPSEVLPGILKALEKDYVLSIEQVTYEFQKGGNEMLRIMLR
ncbi:hypothetical protein [Persicobacter sp. CCB-QB2]|uniref:hypothetical protein n=1 Tax=Persicobacter sp. CCB-QB2 TaxID=1561025 RepID=UPI0006A9BA6C|nr:hypothetical protein [Persicobacter sp. CCB-QB2]